MTPLLLLSIQKSSFPLPFFFFVWAVSFGNLAATGFINLATNSLSGSIPSMSKVVNLVQLTLSNNLFSLPIPSGFGSLTKFNYFDVQVICTTLFELIKISTVMDPVLIPFFHHFDCYFCSKTDFRVLYQLIYSFPLPSSVFMPLILN